MKVGRVLLRRPCASDSVESLRSQARHSGTRRSQQGGPVVVGGVAGGEAHQELRQTLPQGTADHEDDKHDAKNDRCSRRTCAHCSQRRARHAGCEPTPRCVCFSVAFPIIHTRDSPAQHVSNSACCFTCSGVDNPRSLRMALVPHSASQPAGSKALVLHGGAQGPVCQATATVACTPRPRLGHPPERVSLLSLLVVCWRL